MTHDADAQHVPSSAEESIAMSAEDEAQYLHESGDPAEPADEGVGAMTDNEGLDPATKD